ncbi:MAG TPA: hypothetical protein VMI75_15875 [Polyangiaceae bacterium]|nr:hypothetical protein [Polyangiaceae bacterium]
MRSLACIAVVTLASGCHGGSPFSSSHAPFPAVRPANYSFVYGGSAGMTPDFSRLECTAAACSYESGGEEAAKLSFALTAAQQDDLYRLFRENTRPGEFNPPPPTQPLPTDVGSATRQVQVGLETYNDTTGKPFWDAVQKILDAAIAAHAVPVTLDFDGSLAGKAAWVRACGRIVADQVKLGPGGDAGAITLATTALPGTCTIQVGVGEQSGSARVAIDGPRTVRVRPSSAKSLTVDGDTPR